MKLVSDEIFLESLKKSKKFINIQTNPIHYKKRILINLMPSFALKQLVIFISLGEYLKNEGYYVDYFICNGEFEHCDIVKMNDGIDRKLLCERCKIVNQTINLSSFNVHNKKINYKKYENNLQNSMKRFCGDINFLYYKNECLNNLKIASNIQIKNYDFFIFLDHFQNYSISPLLEKFNKYLFLGIHSNFLTLYGGNKNLMCNFDIDFDNQELIKIEDYFKQRIKITKKINFRNQKVVTFFPNLLEDSHEKESNYIFSSMIEWLKESVQFLIENDFTIIIKLHPDEQKWKPVFNIENILKKYITTKKTKNKLFFIKSAKINSFNLIESSDFICVYNGTAFFESLVMKKKVILGGKICNIYHKNKNEYFNQFFSYKSYDYKLALKYAYKIHFFKKLPLKMINLNLPYPNIQDNKEKEQSFEVIKSIIEGNNNLTKFKTFFYKLYSN